MTEQIDSSLVGRQDSLMAAPALTDTEARDGVWKAFARFNPHRIILFGSHARGTADAESDIDLIVVYDTKKRFLDRLRELSMACELPKGVDILAYTPREFAELKKTRAFVQDAIATGKVLYERSGMDPPGRPFL